MPQNKKSVSRLDAMAKEKGFPSYAAWKAWNEKYRKPVTTDKPAPKKNFLQNLVSKIPGHPAQLLGYTSDKMKSAMDNRKKKR
jgi:hypothetical protein